MLAKNKKRGVTREELGAELQGVGTIQKIQEHQLGQIRDLFNATIDSFNQFMSNTNRTLQLTQESQKIMLKRTEILERWIKEFSNELERQNRLKRQSQSQKK